MTPWNRDATDQDFLRAAQEVPQRAAQIRRRRESRERLELCRSGLMGRPCFWHDELPGIIFIVAMLLIGWFSAG